MTQRRGDRHRLPQLTAVLLQKLSPPKLLLWHNGLLREIGLGLDNGEDETKPEIMYKSNNFEKQYFGRNTKKICLQNYTEITTR